jgi:hypothetical protein
VRGVTVLARRDRRRRIVVGVRGGRVTFLAVSRRVIRPRRVLRYVKNVP